SHNYLMAHCHVGHNTQVADQVIIANGALLGGHVVVQDRAFLSGNCLVHQSVRVGTVALMQGGSAISKDLPPYCVARGYNAVCGLNAVGLRRAGVGSEERLKLKRLNHALFRSGEKMSVALAAAGDEVQRYYARSVLEFVVADKWGILGGRGGSVG